MPVTDTGPGARFYGQFMLGVYDFWVLQLSCTYAWRCSATRLRSFYSRNLASARRDSSAPRRLLDIGVGTGYHLSHAPIPRGSEVFLVDLNPHPLSVASHRLLAAHPDVSATAVMGDFLEPDRDSSLAIVPARLGGGKFDAISCMLLLHCVPGPPERKGEALARLAPLLNSEGVLFGSTILGAGVRYNAFARTLVWFYNHLGSFDNRLDNEEEILGPLREIFSDVRSEICGSVLLFEARRPK